MPGSGSGDPPPQTREPTDSSDAETLFTSSDYEARRENLRNENPQGLTRPTSGVDVQRAEEEFAQLSKQLTGISERAKRLSRQQSNRLDEKTPEDIETSTEGEPFDLETTLRGSRTAEADAGIRPKRIGVIWDGLTVRGIGGVRNIVRTFPNAVVDFFNVPQTIMHILGLGRKGKEFEILKNFKGVAKPGEMVLVLGKPSAGCTTFLKVIANQRFGYTGVDGEVRRQVYFGPTKEARAYFEDLGFKEKPRQTTPDYLTGCTDPFEREYKEGRNAENTPSTPDALVQAFEKSRFNEALEQEMDTYRAQLDQEKHVYDDFEMAHLEAKRKFTSKSSVYSIPFYLQVWALMQRQFLIKWQDKFSLAVSWITSIGVAIVLGTVWLKLPTTSAGAFTRGGVLFISLLFNALQAFSELASTMLGRPIVNKHRAYTFHRPSALWIAQIAVDLAFASVQIFVFSVIVYFMCGLVLDAGAFFTFVLIIITGYLSMTLFFRTVGCVCPDFDYALKGVSIIITLFVVTSGYLIQWQDQQVWLRWFFYINAVGLGFSGLMMNEFGRLNMTCTPESLIPAGPGYTNLSHQVCTLPGGDPGSSIIPGSNYIKLQFRYDPADLWRNWGIMVVLIVVFLCANAYLGEALTYGAGGKTVTFFAKETHELKKLNSELQEKKRNRQEKKSEESESNLKIESKSVLSWEDLCYDVPVPGGTRRLLNNVFGYVEPGKLTALMGASGAGKTTLLDVLAARKEYCVITGDILVDDVLRGHRSSAGHLMQSSSMSTSRRRPSEKRFGFLPPFANPMRYPKKRSSHTSKRSSPCLNLKTWQMPLSVTQKLDYRSKSGSVLQLAWSSLPNHNCCYSWMNRHPVSTVSPPLTLSVSSESLPLRVKRSFAPFISRILHCLRTLTVCYCFNEVASVYILVILERMHAFSVITSTAMVPIAHLTRTRLNGCLMRSVLDRHHGSGAVTGETFGRHLPNLSKLNNGLSKSRTSVSRQLKGLPHLRMPRRNTPPRYGIRSKLCVEGPTLRFGDRQTMDLHVFSAMWHLR
ncbi:SNQ2 protein [Coccidioides immitis RMSCC 3703]|uniref:SNQ2 protein n=1 Tax=Coccidioides immitis RMSCC 3703 TaxID=454286 RepID=A0A0J8QRK3_COCIT|nr:SNQ2 protein [Coccidioides immitis RMSCC 3703]